MIRIGFVTGARSEYGIMKKLIAELVEDSDFSVSIIATGMHYQHKYGYTIANIQDDALAPIIDAPCYTEEEQSKEEDFVSLINAIGNVFDKHYFDIIYIIGDRLEAYAAALSAHFHKIPVAHFAGGQLTNGAVDNIYRFNITNLSTLHFVTNKYAVERLMQLPIINKDKVYLVGSSAIDSIKAYLETPQDASVIDSRLSRSNYVLMTFHSETNTTGQKNTIPEVMDEAIKTIVENGTHLLLTYPNNDDGSDAIIRVIEKWQDNPLVVVRKNLGAELYYVAVDNSMFVVGNSSSGVIEIPYFQKYTLNVGERQSGRNAPKSVISIADDCELVHSTIGSLLEAPLCKHPQENIYGDGNSITKIHDIIKSNY
ncbi:MAG: UDP-N-acetylglucosamine 2-epimerase [Mediterranea sp.]|nr:UDP-N-acetylglucosamine 2-epimerase [Mediterranea sp.]